MIRSGNILTVLVACALPALTISPWCAHAQEQPRKAQIRINKIQVILNQPPAAGASPQPATNSNLFVTDRRFTRALRQAENLFGKQQYSEGVIVLQKLILDSPEDFLFYLNEESRTTFRSHKTEALRILSELPDAGITAYENEYGPTANFQFQEAVKVGNIRAVEEVARRFFHTKAGAEASYWLGTHQMDQGNPLAAGMHFDRLRKFSRYARTREPLLTLKTAFCWEQAGFPDKSTATLLELKRLSRNQSFTLGNKQIALFRKNENPRKWLRALMGQQGTPFSSTQTQWALFRGNSQRNASGTQASPVWDSHWRYNTIHNADDFLPRRSALIAAQLKSLENHFQKQNRLTLPAAHPLVIDDIVVFRSLNNIRALRLSTGELLWETVHSDSTYNTLSEQISQSYTQHNDRSELQQFIMQRSWNDLTAGTLSSDGEYVYALEELSYVRNVTQPTRVIGETSLLKTYNKLMAYEIATGKLKWELGGPLGPHQLPLAGSFFLGPPLSLGKQLFVIAESNGEIRLLELDVNKKPETSPGQDHYLVNTAWSQSLLQPSGSVQHSPRKRLAGLSPSFDSGILVCPTASGAVVAIDLARRLLLWGYAYPTRDAPGFQKRQNRFMAFGVGNYIMPVNMTGDRWLDSAVTIADGKALLTPVDSDELHCLNMVDGTILWKIPRGQGLYLAGVHAGHAVIVGRTEIQAFDLVSGKPAWNEPIPIPTPSGRGVRTEHLYRLPLSTGEIATIDLYAGKILARSKSRNNYVPGNLVASNGTIISQTSDAIVSYQPLSSLRQQVDTSLKNNPADPDALALQGEMKLHQGDEAGGLADLKRALALKPNPRSQSVMVATLLEELRKDFTRYQASAEEIRKLDLDPQQRSTFLRLHAEGLQKSGNYKSAFAEYLKLAGPGTVSPTLQDVNSLLSVRTDRLIQPRLKTIYAAAAPEDRKMMDREFETQLALARQQADLRELRKFLKAFSTFPIASRARKDLANRLNEKQHTLELELLLLKLMQSADPETSGFATARLTQLLINLKYFDQAAPFLADLETTFSDVTCLDDKTGKQLAQQWKTDNAIAEILSVDHSWPRSRIESTLEINKKSPSRPTPVPIRDSGKPFFHNWSLKLEQQQRQISLYAIDHQTRKRWTIPVLTRGKRIPTLHANYASTHGHLLAVMFGSYFSVYNTLTPDQVPQLLWEKELYDSNSIGAFGFRPQPRPIQQRNGKFQMVIFDTYGNRLGNVGPITNDLICYQAGATLYAADPLNGETLWKHHNLPRGCDIRMDNNIVTLTAPDSPQTILLDAGSGETISRKTFDNKHLQLLVAGKQRITWSSENDKTLLSAMDIPSETTLWKKDFSNGSVVSIINNEIAVLEPGGNFQIINSADGSTKLQSKIEPNKTLENIVVRRHQGNYILMLNTLNSPNVQGLHSGDPHIHGNIYSFDATTGKTLWANTITHQSFATRQPQDLPILIFASYTFPANRFRNQPRQTDPFRIKILDARNGQIIFENATREQATPFRLNINPDEKTIQLTFHQSIVSLAFADTPLQSPATLPKPTPQKRIPNP